MKLKLTAFIQELITVGNHWLVVFVKSNKVTIFDRFGVEYIPRQIKRVIQYKHVI